MQLNLDLQTPLQSKKAWAFAVDTSRARLRFKRKPDSRGPADLSRCIITACSKEARQFGVQTGMRLSEAKARIPSLKILVCNW